MEKEIKAVYTIARARVMLIVAALIMFVVLALGLEYVRTMTTKGPNLRVGDLYQVSIVGFLPNETPFIYGEWGWDKETAHDIFNRFVNGQMGVLCDKKLMLFVRLSRYVNIHDMPADALVTQFVADNESILPEWTLAPIDMKKICEE